MRFITFTDEIIYAICEFCEEQNTNSNCQDYDIFGMLCSPTNISERVCNLCG